MLDTDIGTDVDDLLALMLIGTDPTVDLVGVTTVYGDVVLRARLASRVLRLLGRHDVPVHAGASTPWSGRAIKWLGHEGAGLPDLETERVHPQSGIDALIAAADRHPGELVVISIGPLTNIAEALESDPAWASKVRRLVAMGGNFGPGRAEHNVTSDVDASDTVLSSRLSTTFVGLDVTTTVWFDQGDLDQVVAPGGELAALVHDKVAEWFGVVGAPRCHPHDPLALLELTSPELFTTARDGWRIIGDGDGLGTLVPDDDVPPIERATAVNVEVAHDRIVAGLRAAVTGAA